MSQELLAVIGEKEVELRQLRAKNAELQSRYDELSGFVARAARAGAPIRIADASECGELPDNFDLPPAPTGPVSLNPAASEPVASEPVKLTPLADVLAHQRERESHARQESCEDRLAEPALSH